MTDIDKLEGVELRKAVAEAVGWEWRNDPWGGEAYTGEERTSWTQFFPDRDLNHAIKACEAAGMFDRYRLKLGKGRNGWYCIWFNGPFVESFAVAQGDAKTGPESLCRALLKALEASDAH